MNDSYRQCFGGEKLYGDDFTAEQIKAWYHDETTGYCEILESRDHEYRYDYVHLNCHHGFRYLPGKSFSHVLGVGAAFGHELLPIAEVVDSVTILEPGEAFDSHSILGMPCRYVTPAVDGHMPFEDGEFDLVTCFGALHHVPNVSTVVREMARCLAPGGFALVREPIVSMGDWRRERKGLTKRERGIPYPLFREMLTGSGLRVVRSSFCVFPAFVGIAKKFGVRPFNSRLCTVVDALLCRVFARNIRYHDTGPLRHFRPASIFFVLRKGG